MKSRASKTSELLRLLRERGIPVRTIVFEDKSRGSLLKIYLYTGEVVRLRTSEKWYMLEAKDLSDRIPDSEKPVDLERLDQLESILTDTRCPVCGVIYSTRKALALHILFEHPGQASRMLEEG